MKVTVPNGVTPGTQFLVRLPPQASIPVAQAVQNSSVPCASSSAYASAYPGQQQQPNMGYPQQMPPNVAYQQQPQVVVVQSAPYGYGYGYGGYDPFLGGMLGFAGGMLIADAMFY